MEMKIIPANGGGPGMDGVFLSGYGDGDYTPRPRSGPLPSLRRGDSSLFASHECIFPQVYCWVIPHRLWKGVGDEFISVRESLIS